MKRLIIILIILGLIGCGTDESLLSIGSSQYSLQMLKQKVEKQKRILTPSLNIIKKVEVSISDNPERLFLDNQSEFNINSVVDLYIGSRFYYYTGVHKTLIKVYLPDGSLYTGVNETIDFNKYGAYSSGGLIIEGSESTINITYIMPVAGTEIAIFQITGKYKVEIELDDVVVAEAYFVLK